MTTEITGFCPDRFAAVREVFTANFADGGELGARFAFAGTRLTSAERIAAGQVRLPGIAEPMPEHCVVKGLMHERIGAVDGQCVLNQIIGANRQEIKVAQKCFDHQRSGWNFDHGANF